MAINMPIQGLRPALIKRSVETYPPIPESAEWPSESWPVYPQTMFQADAM